MEVGGGGELPVKVGRRRDSRHGFLADVVLLGESLEVVCVGRCAVHSTWGCIGLLEFDGRRDRGADAAVLGDVVQQLAVVLLDDGVRGGLVQGQVRLVVRGGVRVAVRG